MSVCPQDASFGPASSCRSLDFTLFFEQAILSFPPDVAVLSFAALRLMYLWYQPNKLLSVGRIHLATKIAACLVILAIDIVIVTLAVGVHNNGAFFMWLPAPAVQLVSAIILAVLVVVEHFRSLTSSTLVICYTFVKGLFNATTLRTYVKIGTNPSDRHLVILVALSTASYLSLCCIELVGKRRLLIRRNLSPISTMNIFSRLSCIWLFPLLSRRSRKYLTFDSLDTIPEEFGSKESGDKLQSALLQTPKGSNHLLFASFRAFGFQFFAPIIPRILLLLAVSAQPLLVYQMIAFVTDSDRPKSHGWALVGGFICIYALITLTTSLYWEKVYNITVQYRAALVSSIYKKSLRLCSAESRTLGSSAASTYISVDIERICQGLEYIHETWSCLVSVGLAIVILYSQATWPAFLPIIVTLTLMFTASFVSRKTGARQAEWLAATDRRVKFLSSIIHNILPIKLSHYEDVMAKKAAEYRSTEMQKAKHFYNFIAFMGGVSNIAGALCIFSVLGPYTALAQSGLTSALDADRLFTIVTTVNLLSSPLNTLGQSFPTIFAAYASIKRIQAFLLLEEKGKPEGDVYSHDDSSSSEKLAEEPAAMIHIVNASFAWTSDREPSLQDLSLTLDSGQLHLCIGPIASGKSLLLLSILRESSMQCGRYVPPCERIAYAPQDAFIFPGTIRENIIFGLTVDENRYKSVVNACALLPDFARLPSGDQTLLDEKGQTLSGGQRQRIGLARAVYAGASWTLLDDPFSAADATTETHIFESLFGHSGILRNKSVLLVTRNVKHLSLAQNIVVLDAGHIRYQGHPSYYGMLSGAAYSGAGLGSPAEPIMDAEKVQLFEKDEEDAPLQQKSVGLMPYIFYASMATPFQAILTLFLIGVVCIGQIGLQFYLRAWSENGDQHAGIWIGGYAAITAVIIISISSMVFQLARLITRFSGINIHNAEVKGLLGTTPSYFMTTPAGRLINRLSQDVFLVDLEFPFSLLNGLWYLGLVIGTLVLVMIPTPYLVPMLVPIGILYGTTLTFYIRTSKQLQHLEAASKSPLYSVFSATLAGIECIRSLGAQRHFEEKASCFLDRSQRPFFFRFAGMRFLQTMLSVISFITATGLSALAVGLRRSVDPSFLGLALLGLTNLSNVLNTFVKYLATIENGSVAVSRIHEIVSLPPEKDPPKDIRTVDWRIKGSIVLENVQLKYQNSLRPAIYGVSVSVQPGQKIGICGRSGSGKSSLVLALLRGLEASQLSGRVMIDDLDTRAMRLGTLRRAFSLVTQDPFLWYASLRENLVPEGGTSDADVWDALQRVGMYEAVSAMPEKLDTVLDDGGSLSKGQRQLLCLARVLLQGRKIIILDEATSSLDPDTTEKILEVIRTELAACTIFAITHQIATIIDFDRILVMEDGAVAENGTPQDLLSRSGGRFVALAASQGLLT